MNALADQDLVAGDTRFEDLAKAVTEVLTWVETGNADATRERQKARRTGFQFAGPLRFIIKADSAVLTKSNPPLREGGAQCRMRGNWTRFVDYRGIELGSAVKFENKK